jgi:hypothetical protein
MPDRPADLIKRFFPKGVKEETSSIREVRGVGIQESGVAGARESGSLAKIFTGDAGPGFSDKDLARLFCNSCNS